MRCSLRPSVHFIRLLVPILFPSVHFFVSLFLKQTQKLRWEKSSGEMECGSDLLFRAVTSQVPSTCWGLTSVFGMGTGGTPRPLPPQRVNIFTSRPDTLSLALAGVSQALPRALTTAYESLGDLSSSFLPWSSSNQLNQAFDRLVSSSYIHYCTSTDDLSTW